MPGNKVQVTLDSDASNSLTDIQKLEQKVEELSKSAAQMGRESAKAAKLASGSYNKLEHELKQNVAELKKMEVGSKAFDAQRAKVAALENQLRGAKQQLNGTTTAGQAFANTASAGVAQVTRLAAGMVGLQQGIAAIVGELEKAKALQLRASRQELTLEAALADIGLNIGGDQLGEARQLIETNAVALGTTQQGLANLLGTAISAGAKDLETALKVSAAGLELTVGDAEKAGELVQTALDITSLSGSDNFRGALGQVAQTQSQVRSVNAQEFFSNIGPALAVATSDKANTRGITTERALELSATVSQLLKDRTGSNTATAVRQFVTRLDSFVPELSAKLKDGSEATLTQEQIDQFRAADTVDARIDLFRGNQALRRQFLDEQKEGIGKGAIGEIIGEGNGRALAIEAKASQAIQGLGQAEQATQILVDGLTSAAGLLAAEGMSRANIESLQTGAIESQEAGAVRKLLTDTLENVNLPGLDSLRSSIAQNQLTAAIDRGKDPVVEVREYLEGLAAGGAENFYTRSLSAQEVEFINRQLASLDRIEAALKARQPVEVKVDAGGPRAIQPVGAGVP